MKIKLIIACLLGAVAFNPNAGLLAQERGATDERPAPLRDNQRPPLNNRNTNHSDDLALDGKMGATEYSMERGVPRDEEGDAILSGEAKKLPKMFKPALSPAGTHIAYFEGIEGQMALTVFNLADGKTHSMLEPENSNFYWFEWANEDRLIFAIRTKAPKDPEKQRFSNFKATRLFAIDKDMTNSLNLFKPIARGGIVQNKPRDVIRNQARVIDLLPNDPAHILLNVDEKRDRHPESRIRKINIYDASYEIVQDERKFAYQWQTDQGSTVRLGYTNFARNKKGDERDFFATYLSPETNEWETIHHRKLFSDEQYTILGFSSDPRFAYINNRKGGVSLYDVISDEKVESYCEGGKINFLIRSNRIFGAGGVIGCRNENVTHYFDDIFGKMYNQVHAAMVNQFPVGNTYIEHARPELNKFIIYSKPLEPLLKSGAYYLLDLKTRSLSKIMDRYDGDIPLPTIKKVSD